MANMRVIRDNAEKIWSNVTNNSILKPLVDVQKDLEKRIEENNADPQIIPNAIDLLHIQFNATASTLECFANIIQQINVTSTNTAASVQTMSYLQDYTRQLLHNCYIEPIPRSAAKLPEWREWKPFDEEELEQAKSNYLSLGRDFQGDPFDPATICKKEFTVKLLKEHHLEHLGPEVDKNELLRPITVKIVDKALLLMRCALYGDVSHYRYTLCMPETEETRLWFSSGPKMPDVNAELGLDIWDNIAQDLCTETMTAMLYANEDIIDSCLALIVKMDLTPPILRDMKFIFTEYTERYGVGFGKDDPRHKVEKFWKYNNKVGERIKKIITTKLPSYCQNVVSPDKTEEMIQKFKLDDSRATKYSGVWLITSDEQFLKIRRLIKQNSKKLATVSKQTKNIAKKGRDKIEYPEGDPNESPDRTSISGPPQKKSRSESEGTEKRKSFYSVSKEDLQESSFKKPKPDFQPPRGGGRGSRGRGRGYPGYERDISAWHRNYPAQAGPRTVTVSQDFLQNLLGQNLLGQQNFYQPIEYTNTPGYRPRGRGTYRGNYRNQRQEEYQQMSVEDQNNSYQGMIKLFENVLIKDSHIHHITDLLQDTSRADDARSNYSSEQNIEYDENVVGNFSSHTDSSSQIRESVSMEKTSPWKTIPKPSLPGAMLITNGPYNACELYSDIKEPTLPGTTFYFGNSCDVDKMVTITKEKGYKDRYQGSDTFGKGPSRKLPKKLQIMRYLIQDLKIFRLGEGIAFMQKIFELKNQNEKWIFGNIYRRRSFFVLNAQIHILQSLKTNSVHNILQ